MKGLLGKAMTTAGVFITPAAISTTANFATMSIDMENTNMDDTAADSNVDIYVTTAATPTALDKVGRAIIKAAGGHATIDCSLASANEKVMIMCNTADIAVRVTGIEDITVV